MNPRTQLRSAEAGVADGNIVELAGRVIGVTHPATASFFGFYDICPWSPSGDRLVVLSCPAEFLEMPNGDKAGVCIWTPATGDFKEIGKTAGWNWQHGARQQWLSDDRVVFNDVDSDGNQCSRVFAVDGECVATYPMAISALHPGNQWGVSANYARLARYYSTYGYANAVNSKIPDTEGGDGLWRLDLITGKTDLLLSYSRICEKLAISFVPTMFVSHPDFSPSGNRVEFFLICDGGAGTSSMRLVVYETDADRLTLVSEEKVSHPAWIDDDRLWFWARESSTMRAISKSGLLSIPGMGLAAKIARKFQGKMRNALLSEGFFVYDFASPRGGGNAKTRIGKGLLNEDGHFSKHPSANVMLGDTYPDANGYLTLLVFSLSTGKRVEVARIKHDVQSEQLALRCDLHPRWSRDGQQVCFDLCIKGVRHVALMDARDAIAQAEAT